MCLWVGRLRRQSTKAIRCREKEDVSAMKVRSSRVTISTTSTPRRRRSMSRQIEINDWMGDLKLTRIDVVAEAEDGGCSAGVEGHDGGAGRQGRREGGAGKSYKIYALHI